MKYLNNGNVPHNGTLNFIRNIGIWEKIIFVLFILFFSDLKRADNFKSRNKIRNCGAAANLKTKSDFIKYLSKTSTSP